jgi:hypothetical protein
LTALLGLGLILYGLLQLFGKTNIHNSPGSEVLISGSVALLIGLAGIAFGEGAGVLIAIEANTRSTRAASSGSSARVGQAQDTRSKSLERYQAPEVSVGDLPKAEE